MSLTTNFALVPADFLPRRVEPCGRVSLYCVLTPAALEIWQAGPCCPDCLGEIEEIPPTGKYAGYTDYWCIEEGSTCYMDREITHAHVPGQPERVCWTLPISGGVFK